MKRLAHFCDYTAVDRAVGRHLRPEQHGASVHSGGVL